MYDDLKRYVTADSIGGLEDLTPDEIRFIRFGIQSFHRLCEIIVNFDFDTNDIWFVFEDFDYEESKRTIEQCFEYFASVGIPHLQHLILRTDNINPEVDLAPLVRLSLKGG